MKENLSSPAKLFPHITVTRPHSIFDLLRQASSKTVRRAVIFTGIAWLPAAILAAVHGVSSLESFLTDFAIQSRLLLVIPLLVLPEPSIHSRAESIAEHFWEAGLICAEEEPGFKAIVARWEHLRTSMVVRTACVVLSYLIVAGFIASITPNTLMLWARGGGGFRYFSVAGTWTALVSMPVVIYLILGAFWEQFLWAWCLREISRLALRLVPAHPDRVGGLSFVHSFIRAQYPLSFIIGTVVAGGVANRVVHDRLALYDFRYVPLIVVAVVMLIFVGPYFVFMRTLLAAKHRGIFEYDAMALRLGRQFEEKWLSSEKTGVGKNYLEVQDFSATVDLYSVVGGVHEMNLLPVSFESIRKLIIVSLLPAVPVILAVVPFESLFDKAVKLLS